MKIETIQQIEETELRVNDHLTIHLKKIGENTFIKLFTNQENTVFIEVLDWQGDIHQMRLEIANQVIVNEALNPEISNSNIPF